MCRKQYRIDVGAVTENGCNVAIIAVTLTFVPSSSLTSGRMWQNKQQRSYPALAQVGERVL